MIKTYTGVKIAPMGKLRVRTKCENKRCVLDPYVLKKGGVPLFGCEWHSAQLAVHKRHVSYPQGNLVLCAGQTRACACAICTSFPRWHWNTEMR